ncbi:MULTISPECIES: peptidoglycan-binding protein [Cellulosimicrobium]|uniref:peptidoglycan-binding protein n=1 Tax=Cellulosimicrobium TaxID=157920 RepID=UPI002098117E|nr:peptidoglycan-binding protein [Cellulosimicrobium cellulans]MCO7274759.1 peptidoglycan-binding protein [Cellulosimicrobium cellulans]
MIPRRRVVVGAVVTVLLVGGLVGGWFAAASFQSPAQVAANAAPPPPGDIVATVTFGALSEQITARSDVVRESAASVQVAAGSGDQSVVTAVGVPAGSELRAGAVVLEVSGRPVIATTGAFPYYRDLVEGATGPDVEQLQRFLRDLGYRVGGLGEFGPQTAQAVRALYKDIGYEPTTREAPADELQTPGQNAPAPSTGDAVSEVAPTDGTGTDPAAPVDGTTGSVAPAAPAQLVVVPRGELVVTGSLPAVVGTTPDVGDVLTAENATITLGQGAVVAQAKVAVSVLPVLGEGMTATLSGPDGTVLDATLGAIPAPPTATGDEAAPVEVGVPLVAAQPIDSTWLGANVLTTITVSAVADEALRVPARAVAVHSDGTAVVQRREPDGSFREVEVRELGRLGGTSAVEPVTADALSAGDEVKVE